MSREVLVTVTGDGTFRAPAPASVPAGSDATLEALLRLRSMLGDDLEEQIATRLTLPAALGTDATDHLLPASLVLLAGTTGDLASYGWRVGTGSGLAWRRARDRREQILDAARIAWLGYEGPVQLTTLGPLTLAGATFLGSGERTVADRGALRELPVLLAEGLIDQAARVRRQLPGAAVELLIREDGIADVLHGRLPTPSGYRRYPAVPAEEIAPLWRSLLAILNEEELPATLAPGAEAPLLRAARSAGAGSLAVDPAGLPALEAGRGRDAWETLATAREAGEAITWVLHADRPERTLDHVAASWRRLGHGPAELAGFTLQAAAAPVSGPVGSALLTEAELTTVLRQAPPWAERIRD